MIFYDLDQEQAELLSFLLFVVPGIVEDLVQVFQPVAATFDVENVAVYAALKVSHSPE